MFSERLYPSPQLTQPFSTPLSILDATCARFSDTGAIWFFDAPANGCAGDVLVDHLRDSLIETLSLFPQWAGQLHWAPFRLDGKHTERFNRLMITYGSDSDPGIEWNVVLHEFDIKSVIPDAGELASGAWVGDSFPQAALLSKSKVSLYNLKDYEGLPCMLVQVNLFPCGGYAISIRIAHPVADASSMMVFVHQWAAHSRSRFGTSSASLFDAPVFDPSQLDSRASGDIEGNSPDQDIVSTARGLPLNRFSWWETDAPGYSPWLVNSTNNSKPPADILAKSTVSPSTPAPWTTWDLTRPQSFALLHFTGKELSHLQALARAAVATEGSDISKTDTLLSHLFRLVTKARAYAQSPHDEVFLNVSLDARRRVAPPLPATLVGSPLFLTHIRDTASAVREASTGSLALRLRETMKKFGPDEVAALLHDAAHEVAPQRQWLGFLGHLHIIVTSWQWLRLYGVDFEGQGGRPRYVHAVMPKSDGILVLLDPVVPDGGVDVAVYLDAETMPSFLEEVKGSRAAYS